MKLSHSINCKGERDGSERNVERSPEQFSSSHRLSVRHDGDQGDLPLLWRSTASDWPQFHVVRLFSRVARLRAHTAGASMQKEAPGGAVNRRNGLKGTGSAAALPLIETLPSVSECAPS